MVASRQVVTTWWDPQIMIFLAFASVSTRLVVLGASVLALRYRAPEILFGCEDYSLGSEPRMQSSSQSFISFCTGAYTMFSLLVLASFIYIYIYLFFPECDSVSALSCAFEGVDVWSAGCILGEMATGLGLVCTL